MASHMMAVEGRWRGGAGSKLLPVGLAACCLGLALLAFGSGGSSSQERVVLDSIPGAGYHASGAAGLASKVLLEQAQEAAELGRRELEQAAEAYNKASAAKAKRQAALNAQTDDSGDADNDEEDADKAGRRAAAAKEKAGAAKEARARHIEHAHAALEAAQRAAREAAKIGAQYDSAHAEADEAKTDQNHSADTLAKVSAAMEKTLADLTRLKKQLVLSQDWTPWVDIDTQDEAALGVSSGASKVKHLSTLHLRAERPDGERSLSALDDSFVPAHSRRGTPQ